MKHRLHWSTGEPSTHHLLGRILSSHWLDTNENLLFSTAQSQYSCGTIILAISGETVLQWQIYIFIGVFLCYSYCRYRSLSCCWSQISPHISLLLLFVSDCNPISFGKRFKILQQTAVAPFPLVATHNFDATSLHQNSREFVRSCFIVLNYVERIDLPNLKSIRLFLIRGNRALNALRNRTIPFFTNFIVSTRASRCCLERSVSLSVKKYE